MNKIKHKILLIGCLLILTLIQIPGYAKSQKLKIGYVEFPPYTFTNKYYRPDGLIVNRIITAIERAGYTWDAESFPGKRLFRNIARGYTDIFIGIKGIPMLRTTTYTGRIPIGKIEMRIYYIGNKKPIFKKEDLKGKSVILVRGYGYTDGKLQSWTNYIKDRDNKIIYEEARGNLNAFEKLKARRAAYLLEYKLPALQTLKKIYIPNLKYNTIHSANIYIIISKKTKNARIVLKKIQREFRKNK